MTFYKYHGAGNDFILIDNRNRQIFLSNEQVAFLCNRHLGIGADGLMLLELADGYDFKMVYYNSDGNESSMCGNGGRCITAFAKHLGIIGDATRFLATDGPHTAYIRKDGLISLYMKDVTTMNIFNDHTLLDTGSPHYVLWVNNVDKEDVVHKGRNIRNQSDFGPAGINVNFVQIANNQFDGNLLRVRTYERGVEDETLSCGTGVTAAAIASTVNHTGSFEIEVVTPGGHLGVSFVKDSPTSARDVVLTGPAMFVFKGEVDL